jgi:hypothetical protein
LAGWREVKVTQQRKKGDFAKCIRDLVDIYFPDAEVIRVVLDNLNIHSPGSLYEAFAPQAARRILRKLEFPVTPKHGSWLNMAEIELAILSRQCLKQRVPDQNRLVDLTRYWTAQRTKQQATINWCLDVGQARTKLMDLDPDRSAEGHRLAGLSNF